MFARTAFRACARAPAPLRQAVPRRTFTTTEETKPRSKSSAGILLGLTAALAGTGYYFYTQGTTAAPLPPAIPTLTGDNQWIDLKLSSVSDESPNTKRLRFALPTGSHVSGLEVASCLLTKFKGPDDKKPTIRPYTPISDEDQRGFIDLIVKKYPNGPMSTHIHSLKPEDTLSFKGPMVKYPWTPNKHEHVALIAGGTGIAPMYQIIRGIFKNPEDKTKVTLVFGNVSEEDVLLRKELIELENTYPQRFRAVYLLDNAPESAGWAQKGYVTKELLKQVLPEPGSGNNKIFVCGPPGMYKAISGNKVSPKDQGELSGILKELGYKAEDVFKF